MTRTAQLGAAWLCIAALGCGWGDTDRSPNAQPRGAPRGPERSTAAGPRVPNVTLGTSELEKAQAEPLRPPAEPLKAPEPEKEVEERDLAQELRAAIGSPVDCLRPRTGPDVPKSIKVDLEAHLVETGMVTRAYARSSQLDEAELECVRKRLSALRLAPPIEQSPRTVASTLEFTLKVADPPSKPAP